MSSANPLNFVKCKSLLIGKKIRDEDLSEQHASNLQVTKLRARGQEFLTIPKKYYTNLREKLKQSKVQVTEDIDTVSTIPFYFVSISH